MCNEIAYALKKKNIQECEFVDEYVLCPNGIKRKIPIYNINGYNGLNQIIGYAQYVNKNKKILYRGQKELHDTMMPSLYRGLKYQRGQNKAWIRLKKMIQNALRDDRFAKSTGISRMDYTWQKELALEALLQHYGMSTRCIDVVDNHWIALWFGSYDFQLRKQDSGLYGKYTIRIENDKYQYIILFAVSRTIDFSDVEQAPRSMYAVDLRKVLPSIYLRPHAQHGWIIRNGKIPICDNKGMAENVIGILKIRVAQAKQWLGDGHLLTVSNLFPSSMIDQGYEIFLSREDLFGKNAIMRYVY